MKVEIVIGSGKQICLWFWLADCSLLLLSFPKVSAARKRIMRLLCIHHINDHNFGQEMNMCHMKKFVLPRYLYQSMHMASPSLPSVETSYSFDREMIHCVQWMHSAPWVLSETALAGLQFVILAWHEAGKIPAADSLFLFFPLRPNSTFSVWLFLHLALRLRCRIHPRPTRTGKQ